jgi:hypothetical protein
MRRTPFNVCYIITTYILNLTPTVTRPNYGLGPLTNIEISIIQTPTPTNTNITNTIETTVGISFGSNVVIVVIVLSTNFVLLRKNKTCNTDQIR